MTPEEQSIHLVGRLAKLERELEQEREASEDMRDLLREIFNLTQLDRDCPIDLPHRALVHIGHLIEEKTPPPTAAEIDAHLDECLAKSEESWKPLPGDPDVFYPRP